MAYVDLPLAQFLDRTVRHTQLWTVLEGALRPIALVPVAAMVFLLGCGLWLISGYEPGSWTRFPLALSWATMFAVAAQIILKRIFGRSWPDPTFVRDHLYGFQLLHGRTHWDSFPSGTAMVSMALLSGLWISKPRWRLPGLLASLLLVGGVVIANFHWLSDVIAGIFLGVTVGCSTLWLLHPTDKSRI